MSVNIEKVKEILLEIHPIKLIAATKYGETEDLYALEKCGVKIFGENRVPVLLEKYEQYQGSGEFHMIGTLQRNKVKYIIDKVSMIHSVDCESLLEEIEKQACKHQLTMSILLQVNIAKEPQKHGFHVEEIDEIFTKLLNYPHIECKGFMMMAPHIDADDTQIYFKEMKDLLQSTQEKHPQFNLCELSMGMSNDYQIAILNGATMVRIGSVLFNR